MSRCALVVTAALLIGGCGAEEEDARAPAGGAAGETRLTIEVRPEGPRGGVRRERLTCPGDARCGRLDRAALRPVPGNVACTEIYGGPATATVIGTLRGRRVHATFSRVNGCEIARWDRLAWLLGRVEGPRVPPGP